MFRQLKFTRIRVNHIAHLTKKFLWWLHTDPRWPSIRRRCRCISPMSRGDDDPNGLCGLDPSDPCFLDGNFVPVTGPNVSSLVRLWLFVCARRLTDGCNDPRDTGSER